MRLDLPFIWEAFVRILPAIKVTIELTLVSTICGLILGTLVAIIRVYKVPVLQTAARLYVTFIRGTPALTHLLLVYYGLPMAVDGLAQSLGWSFRSGQIPMIAFAHLAFTITAGAYMSEIVRSGLLAVPRGQLEAAYSLGMTRLQALRRIVFPQAFAACLPNLSNMAIIRMHGSSLAFMVAVVDINAQAKIVAASNLNYFEAFLAAAAIYWGLTILMERLAGWLEKRVNRYQQGGVR